MCTWSCTNLQINVLSGILFEIDFVSCEPSFFIKQLESHNSPFFSYIWDSLIEPVLTLRDLTSGPVKTKPASYFSLIK